MKRMHEINTQDLKFLTQEWSHTVDLINGAIGLRSVGSEDVNWSNGTTKFFYCKGGSEANRFQGGIKVQPYVATGLWQDIKKADFDRFPAAGSKTELILDLSGDDMVSIPSDAFIISSKSSSAESTLVVINQETGGVIHKINYASTANMSVVFDAIDFIDQIKYWYRQKGWIESDGKSETIVIPSNYITVTNSHITVEEEALPPEVRINYSDSPDNHIYVLQRAVVSPQ